MMFEFEKLIGHRGAAAYAPENTLASFERARSLGCKMIEFDVMLSADGETFIFHDESLKRTTNGRGEIGLVSSEYVKSLDAGSWFSKRFINEKIPTLKDALVWLIKHDMKANIEIKPYPGQTEATSTAVLTALTRYWPLERPLPLVSSFDVDALHLCRSLAPEMPLGLLLDAWDKNWLKLAKDLHCVSVHLNKKLATKAHVNEIKQGNYKVCTYTVNSKREAAALFSLGVDAIFSDYPDLLGHVDTSTLPPTSRGSSNCQQTLL